MGLGSSAMANLYRERPRLMWSITGAVVGVAVGYLLIRNFGVASGGRGFGVWGWLLGACIGTYIGFRFGEWHHRHS